MIIHIMGGGATGPSWFGPICASAYAHEAMFVDALVVGILGASDRVGYRLVDDDRLEDALDSACDAAHRVEDWAFPTQCAWYGEGALPAYVEQIGG